MVRQSVRIALLVGAVAAVAAAPGRAAAQAGCCTPQTRTICCTECVPETYQVKRITYRTEQKVEKYTAYRCESTQECRERTVCCNRYVSEWQDQVRKVCVKVPCCEERTVLRPHYSYVTETKYVTKCVDRGHYECQEVYSHFKALCNGLHGLCSHGCGSSCGGCGDACGGCNTGCNTCCAPSNCVTRKVWVPCMVQEQCPVTCCRKVCEMRPEVCKVQTCRTEWREECCKVCVKRCIPETRVEKYTVCVKRMVPYEACRTVCCRIPCEEMVTCTRWVTRQVTKEVPCCTPTTSCCDTGCNTGCSTSCCGSHGLFHGCSLFGRGCGSSCGGCGTSCGSSCGGCGGHSWFSGLFSGCGGCGSSCGGCGGARTGCCN
jgi:hypothetical protein